MSARPSTKVAAVVLLLGVLLVPASVWAGDEALFIAPKRLYPGSEASATIHAFAGTGGTPREASFEIRLAPGSGPGEPLAAGATDEGGWATMTFRVPSGEEGGAYRLSAVVDGVREPLVIPVTVIETRVLLIETDKPIYKPAQTIHGRVLLLNNALRPLRGDVEVEIRDAKRNKIYRREHATDAFGVAPFGLPLADELNAGPWSIRARCGDATAEATVQVEPYVLPRFRVEVAPDRGWFLRDEAVAGSVQASYFFGKPVEGEILVVAKRMEGEEWEEYARYTAAMHEGEGRFEIEPLGSRGTRGGVTLQIAVTDTADHAERATQLVRIAEAPFEVRLLARSPSAKPGLPVEVAVETTDPAGRPVPRPVEVTMIANDDVGRTIGRVARTVVTQRGRAAVRFPTPAQAMYLVLEAETSEGPYRSGARIYGPVAYSPTRRYVQLRRAGEGALSVGEEAAFEIIATGPGPTFYEVLAGGRSVRWGRALGDVVRFQATPDMAPEARLLAYRIFPDGELATDSYAFQVSPSQDVDLDVAFDAEEVEPGDPVKIEIDAGRESVVGLAVVDESVFALSEGRLDLARIYREVAGRFGGPSEAERQADFADRPHTIGARDVLAEAGLGIAISQGPTSSGALQIPEGYSFWPGDYAERGTYGLAGLTPTSPGGPGSDGLAEVERVRQFFPETWVWEPALRTDTAGRATLELTAPDSITSWRLRAVSTSPAGLGMAGGALTVFQDFFVEPDLPYAITRGEIVWLPVAVYNYLEVPQTVLLELEPNEGFEILGDAAAGVDVGPNAVTAARFPIRASGIGSFPFKLTARGRLAADAVIRPLRVEPEGAPQEQVENRALRAGEEITFDTSFPASTVEGSASLTLTVTGSQVAQTLDGLEDLCGRPYG